MRYFYEGIKKGLPKDEALRAAKLKYLDKADPLLANPYYWGNFIFVGNPEPVEVHNRLLRSWILLLIGFALISACLYVIILIHKRRLKEHG